MIHPSYTISFKNIVQSKILKILIVIDSTERERRDGALSNIILGQNVIGRITHGLIGLDIFTREKKENRYLQDFLSLEAREINAALTSASAGRLVPNARRVSFEESTDLLQKILQAQEVVRHISKADQTEIDLAVQNLKKATRLFYELYRR